VASPRTRLLVSTVSFAAAAVAAGAWIAFRPRAEAIRLLDNGQAAEDLLLKRRSEVSSSSPRAEGSAVARTLREPLDLEAVKSLWAFDPAFHAFDPHAYYRYKAGLERDFGSREGVGGYHFHVSQEGYREDFDRLRERRDRFVVVAGDSHTDGVCENRLTFPNRLEAMLAEREPGQAIEVLNTGVAGYSFYNYLGSLERHLDLAPDAFVVAIYGGNDFLDMIRPWHYFHHTAPPPRSQEYWKKLSGAEGLSSAFVGNAFNQLLYFQYNPDQMDVALRAAGEVCAEIVDVCRARGIALFFVYIPPEIRGSPEQRDLFKKILASLELSEADCAQFDRLADNLTGKLRALGADVIDLRRDFSGEASRYYCSDLHINVAAHERIAELLLPLVDSAFRPR
jgi:hypothetical protein